MQLPLPTPDSDFSEGERAWQEALHQKVLPDMVRRYVSLITIISTAAPSPSPPPFTPSPAPPCSFPTVVSLSLLKHYGQVAQQEQKQWICPACRGECNCAACTRRKQLEEEEAAELTAFHHHHHAHVTIHSLPHHIHPHPQHSTASHHPHHTHPHPHPPSRASCHQCKSSKAAHSLLACSSRRSLTADGKRLRDCKKKFCGVCLERWYGVDITQVERAGWECPACQGICPCAACRRKGGVGRKGEEGTPGGGEEEGEEGGDGSDEEEGSEPRVKRSRFAPHHHHHHSHVRHAHHPYGLHAHPHHHHDHDTAPVSTSASTSGPLPPLSRSDRVSEAVAATSAPFHSTMTGKVEEVDIGVMDFNVRMNPSDGMGGEHHMQQDPWSQRDIPQMPA